MRDFLKFKAKIKKGAFEDKGAYPALWKFMNNDYTIEINFVKILNSGCSKSDTTRDSNVAYRVM